MQGLHKYGQTWSHNTILIHLLRIILMMVIKQHDAWHSNPNLLKRESCETSPLYFCFSIFFFSLVYNVHFGKKERVIFMNTFSLLVIEQS